MKKKGFTLIELLAVIVILAVIALIATPAVLNIIEDSKKAAAEASARNIVSAAKSYYMQNLMDNISIGTIDLYKKTLAYDGEQATKGSISYDKNGNAYGKMYVSGYCVEIKSDGTVSSDKVKESECSIDIVSGDDSSQTTFSGIITLRSCDGAEPVVYIYDGQDDSGIVICSNEDNKIFPKTCVVNVKSGYVYGKFMKSGTGVTINDKVAKIDSDNFTILFDSKAPCAS